MTMLRDLPLPAPRSEALIRISSSTERITLNAAAADLLGIEAGDKVAFKEDRRADGMTVIYVGKRGYNAYRTIKRKNGYIINSAALKRYLCDVLDGPGAYRIEQESEKDFSGNVYYQVFFKRFE